MGQISCLGFLPFLLLPFLKRPGQSVGGGGVPLGGLQWNYKIGPRVDEDRGPFGSLLEPPYGLTLAHFSLSYSSRASLSFIFGLSSPLLTSLNVFLLICFDFPEPQTLPEPQKSMKNHWFS